MHDLIRHPPTDIYFWPDMVDRFPEILIFGAGGRGVKFAAFLKKRSVAAVAFLDNDPAKQGTAINGIPIHAPDQGVHKDLPVVVCCHDRKVYYELIKSYDEVYLDFRDNEFVHHVEHIDNFRANVERDLDFLEDDYSRQSYLGLALKSYDGTVAYRCKPPFRCYEHPVVHAEQDDIIYDIGPYHGLFATHFCLQTGNSCFIHAFEPNHANLAECLNTLVKAGIQNNVMAHMAGIWYDSGIHYLDDPNKTAVSSLSDNSGTYPVKTWTIDDYVAFSGQVPTFIVLERAGLGEMVLQSAHKSISTYKPRLMLPVCPGAGDIISQLHELSLGYAFYFTDHKSLAKEIFTGFLYAI